MWRHFVILFQLLLQLSIFCHFFKFHESKPSGPLTNRLKWFCLKIILQSVLDHQKVIFVIQSYTIQYTLTNMFISLFSLNASRKQCWYEYTPETYIFTTTFLGWLSQTKRTGKFTVNDMVTNGNTFVEKSFWYKFPLSEFHSDQRKV